MRVKIGFETEIPKGASDKQIDDWLRYELFINGSIEVSNPLVDEPVKAIHNTFRWEYL